MSDPGAVRMMAGNQPRVNVSASTLAAAESHVHHHHRPINVNSDGDGGPVLSESPCRQSQSTDEAQIVSAAAASSSSSTEQLTDACAVPRENVMVADKRLPPPALASRLARFSSFSP